MIYALDTNTISNLFRGEGNVEKNFQQEIIQIRMILNVLTD